MEGTGTEERRRWPRRLLVLAALVAGLFAYRGRKLEAADRRYPPPPRRN